MWPRKIRKARWCLSEGGSTGDSASQRRRAVIPFRLIEWTRIVRAPSTVSRAFTSPPSSNLSSSLYT